MRIGLVVEYDGTDFHGSQLQTRDRTVQGELEAAVFSVFGKPSRVYMASRTDAGVHGTGQVAAFNIETDLPDHTIQKALNHYLPDDLAVATAATVAPDFNPRRDARSREYRYTINDRPARSPYSRRRTAHVRSRLDHEAMAAAACRLEGEHDFAAFAGPATPPDAITVRRMERVAISRDGDHVEIDVCGNAFLHQQVRRFAGTLVKIGRSKMDPDDLQTLVDDAGRGRANDLAPARGLCLTKVNYPGADESGLPRAVRS